MSVYGGWIEDKYLTMSYHYDEIDENVKSMVVTEISNIVRRYGYVAMTGHNVVEIKPPVVWTKGHAAQLILNDAFGSKWEKKVHVLYMGDDTSDEDVMRVSFLLFYFFLFMEKKIYILTRPFFPFSAIFSRFERRRKNLMICFFSLSYISDVERSINYNISYNS